jgi:uncharacterized spore protein YtfJ
MDLGMLRDLLTQVQTGARVQTAIGDPVSVGTRTVIPVAEVRYGGGDGGGGGGFGHAQQEAGGGGGGGGVQITPLGCWVIGDRDAQWVPAVDANRLLILLGALIALLLGTVRALARR